MSWATLGVLLAIPNLALLFLGSTVLRGTPWQTVAVSLQFLLLLIQFFALYKAWKEVY